MNLDPFTRSQATACREADAQKHASSLFPSLVLVSVGAVLRDTNPQLDDEDKVANVFETLGHREARMVLWSNISLRHLASFVDGLQLNSFSEPVRTCR